MKIFSFTLDADWAPCEVINNAINLFDDFFVRCTIFLTSTTTGINVGNHEIASHPNFTDVKTLEETLVESLRLVPGSIGIRSHTLFYTARLLPLYSKYGIKYDSNVVMFNMPNIIPYKLNKYIWELPIFYMDNIHFWMNSDTKSMFNPNFLNIESDGLKIFVFHPINIFLNTEKLSRYESIRPYYQNTKELQKYINPESSDLGIRVKLKRLLKLVSKNNWEIKTLSEIVEIAEKGIMD